MIDEMMDEWYNKTHKTVKRGIGMRNKKPPFEITNQMIDGVAEIAELVGKLDLDHRLTSNPTLRRSNRIRTFNRHQSELLFKVISDRSEKSSTIVTTNLPFSKWTELFENTTMVAALIDRLTFRSHVLDMNGDSYRLKATMQKRA